MFLNAARPAFSQPRQGVFGGVRARALAACSAALALAVLAGCASGPPPVFDGPRTLGSRVMMYEPVLRVPETMVDSPRDRDLLSEALETRLRQALAGNEINSERVDGSEISVQELRANLLDVWRSQRGQAGRRLRIGTQVELPPGTEALAASGARSVILPVLSGRHPAVDGSGYVPLPHNEVMWLPEERPDYEIPTAGAEGMNSGVDLDIIVLDLGTGQISAHRKVIYPAADAGDIMAALPVMVREVTRGLIAR